MMFPRHSSLASLSYALIATTLCLLSTACSNQSKQAQGLITKKQVSAFLDRMDQAANKKDIDAIIPMLSKDVQFKITIDGFGMTQNFAFNRDQYIDYGRQGFAALDAYEYRRGETAINVEPDGQSASVADEVFEASTARGKTLRTVARTTSILKLENGKLVIVSSEGAILVLNGREKTMSTKF